MAAQTYIFDLKAELDAGHPITGAYNVDDALAAGELNLANIEVEKLTTPLEAMNATDATEFNALTDADKSLWASVLAWETINLNAGVGLATATGIWAGAAGTITRPALIATRTQLINRATDLGLQFKTVATDHVTKARTLP